MHYSLIDASGNEIPVRSNPGDCLFDSLGAAIGESGASIRAKVASTLREQPIDSARGTLFKKVISRKIRMTENPQCGNSGIFLSLRFYVKSILGSLEVVKLPFFCHFRGCEFC